MIEIHHGDSRDVLAQLAGRSIDAGVTDPPYDLTSVSRGGSPRQFVDNPYGRSRVGADRGFMGRTWDGTGIAFDPAFWRSVLRVMKPGAHLLSFGGTRTHHRMISAIEDAGFEIRDCLMWLYGAGFPKSHNLDGEHEGWGTALKPAWEPIVLARAPLSEPTVAANVARWGTGALNIEAGRISVTDAAYAKNASGDRGHAANRTRVSAFNMTAGKAGSGRWPANLVLSHRFECLDGVCPPDCAVAMLDAQSGVRTSGLMRAGTRPKGERGTYGRDALSGYATDRDTYADTGGASRFFYVAKASRAEREVGLHDRPLATVDDGRQTPIDNPYLRGTTERRNTHPTVKPLALMRYLCRLVTPPGGVVLDPFAGSGSTGCAAALEGFGFAGIEQDAEHVEIARARIAHFAGEERTV